MPCEARTAAQKSRTVSRGPTIIAQPRWRFACSAERADRDRLGSDDDLPAAVRDAGHAVAVDVRQDVPPRSDDRSCSSSAPERR